MKGALAVVLALTFVLTSFAPFTIVSGGVQGPTVEWRFQMRALAYPGQPTSPQVVDLDGDGGNEIVVASAESVYVIRAKGTQKWRYSFDGLVTGVVAADIDANTEKEVIAVTDAGVVHCLNRDGSHLWSSDTGGAIHAAPAIADADGNGRMEIYVGTMKGDLFVLNELGVQIKKVSLPGWSVDRPLVVNPTFLSQGPPFLLLSASVGTSGSKLAAFDNTLVNKWSIDTASAITADVALGDIDLDGTLELEVPEEQGLCTYNANNGTKEWCSAMPVPGAAKSLALADVEGDGKLEALLGTDTASLAEIRSDGTLGWQGALANGVVGISAVRAPDLNAIAVTDQGRVEALDSNGLQLWHKDLGFTANRTAVAADTDADSEMEVLAVGTDGDLVLLNTHQPIKAAWPMLGHDLHNDRNLDATAAGEVPFMQKWAWPNWPGLGYAMLVDVDKDGKDEFFWISEASDGVMRDSEKGLTIRSIAQSLYVQPIAADLDGDGAKEIIFGTQKNLIAWRGNMVDLWNISLPKPSALAAGDVNGDGKYEVFAANQTGHIIGLRSDGGQAWAIEAGSFVTSLTVADLGSDGSMELIYATEQPQAILTVLNATGGALKWSSNPYVYDIAPPVVGDFDGDGLADILLADDTGDIVAFSGNGTKIWSKTIIEGMRATVATAGDSLGGSPGQDLSMVLRSGDILVIDGSTGNNIRTLKHIITTSYMAQVTAAYLGTTEPVVAGYCDYSNFPNDPALFWDDGVSSLMNEMPVGTLGTDIVFGDFDGNGLIEMAHNNGIFVLGVGPGPTIPWSMGGHDPEQTYNPFAKGGRIFPDLTIGVEDITFDPIVANGAIRTNVTVTYRNQGPVAAGPFDITLSKAGTNLTTFNIPSLAPFSEATVTYKWSLTYENTTLDVTIDSGNAVKELRETNNKASRTIFKNLRPVANAGGDLKTDPNKAVILDGGQSKDPDGDIVSYQWNFDDGTTASGPIVSHAFNKSGPFNVVLIVTDEYGATGQDNMTVWVNHPPSISDWRPKVNATVNEGELIGFWVQIGDVDGDKVTVTWYLDGNRMAQGDSWSWWANYSSSGGHTVMASASDGSLVTNRSWKLTVIDSGRLILDATPETPVTIPGGQTQKFTVVLSQVAQDATISWLFDGHLVQSDAKDFSIFAGGDTQGRHELSLIIWADNAWDFFYWNITIGPKKDVPRIRWAFPDTAGVSTVLGTPVYLGISSEGGTAQWYIDGKAQVGENEQSFRFDTWANSTYNVTVIVSSGTDSVSRNWLVTIEHPPTAVIEASALVVKVNKRIDLDARKSSAYKATDVLTSYKWDFGDGTTETGQAVKHAYKKAGGYQVTLTVTDSRGMTASAKATIVVQPEQQAATPGFEGAFLFLAIAVAGLAIARRRKA